MTSLLVLGGTRSGKSAVAEAGARHLAGADGAVTYIATATVTDGDAEHQARIDAHRARRPATWSTIECPDPSRLAPLVASVGGVVLVDSLGTWVAGFPDCDPGDAVDALADAVATRTGPLVIVSEEVGSSLHAPTAVGRAFVDAVGTVNQAIAAQVDRTWLVVAGRIVPTSTIEDALAGLDVAHRRTPASEPDGRS